MHCDRCQRALPTSTDEGWEVCADCADDIYGGSTTHDYEQGV